MLDVEFTQLSDPGTGREHNEDYLGYRHYAQPNLFGGDGVFARDRLCASPANQVAAGVADVGDHRTISPKCAGNDRCCHASLRGGSAALLIDLEVRRLNRASEQSLVRFPAFGT